MPAIIDTDIYLPEGTSGSTPLLVCLHGGGRDGASQIELWKPLAAREKIIVLAPNSLKPPFIEATWFTANDGQVLANRIEEVVNRYAVDRSKIYCFGHSVGATKALEFGFYNRHFFAAVALHSPMQASGIYQLKAEPGSRRLPLTVWVGEETSDSNWHTGTTLLYAYNDHPNFSIDLKVIPKHHHNDIYVRPGLTGEIWEFLSQHAI